MTGVAPVSLSRLEVYEAWRAACEACMALRDALYGRGSVVVAASAYAHLGAMLDDLRGGLSAVAPALVSTLDPAPPVLDRAALDQLERLMTALGTLVIDASPVRLGFVPRPVPLPVERAFLEAALALDAKLALGDRIELRELAAAAGLDMAQARGVVCQWLDDGLVYMPRSKPGPLGPEGITLLDAAHLRAETWDDYADRRKQDP